MSHHLRVDLSYCGPSLELVCTATPGSPCRRRPADPGRETWAEDDPDLIDGECWAVEWFDADRDSLRSDDGCTWPTIPVSVGYDWDCGGGVVVAPTAPHPLLWREGGAA